MHTLVTLTGLIDGVERGSVRLQVEPGCVWGGGGCPLMILTGLVMTLRYIYSLSLVLLVYPVVCYKAGPVLIIWVITKHRGSE